MLLIKYFVYHYIMLCNYIYYLFIHIGERQELGMSFTRHPQPLAAPLNDDVNFECSLNLAAERFAWHHRPLGAKKWIPLPHPYNSSGKTSRHVVNFNNESKAGDYRCIAFFGKFLHKLMFYIYYFNPQQQSYYEIFYMEIIVKYKR